MAPGRPFDSIASRLCWYMSSQVQEQFAIGLTELAATRVGEQVRQGLGNAFTLTRGHATVSVLFLHAYVNAEQTVSGVHVEFAML